MRHSLRSEHGSTRGSGCRSPFGYFFSNLLDAGLVQPAIPVAVEEIDHEADQQPDSEPLPCRSWEAAHDEQAPRRGEHRHGPNEWDLEGSFPVWILVPE